jgi:uncharacterized membrane protein
MILSIRRLRQAHELLARRSLYPVLLSSALAVILFAGRVYLSRTAVFAFLGWNLILAWIPYLLSLWADYLQRHYPRYWWGLFVPGVLWLTFLPNASYIVTDFWHLTERPPVPIWYDIGLLAVFSLSGLFLAVLSLQVMQRLVRYYAGSTVSWLFVMVVTGLSGLGVYLGRFLRWNSWDLLLHPRGVLADVATRVADPLAHRQTFGVTFLFGAILFLCYLALTSREPA